MTGHHIQVLPDHLVDQIKAGEVIERPASLLKELLENSLDAGSTRIEVQIKENGLELLSVTDNGHGMSYEDLPLAFCRHATSKIKRFEDLYQLHSFGFRGEALASVAGIARTTCISVPPDGNGGRIEIEGGKQTLLTEHKNNGQGTSLFVRDLFYNTPARLKFVRSKVSEKNALKRILNAFILANPQVAFSVQWDDKDKEIYTASDLEGRFKQIIGKKAAEGVRQFSGEYEGHKVLGFYTVGADKGTQKLQMLFMNGRYFMESSLHQIVVNSLANVWRDKGTGAYVVALHVPPNKVDVNVHPNKTKLKFAKPSVVFSMASSAIKRSLPQRNDHRQEEGREPNEAALPEPSYSTGGAFAARDEKREAFPTQAESFIGQNFFLFSNPEGHAVIDVRRLLRIFWVAETRSRFPLKEEDTLPQLISGPLEAKTSIDKHLPFLKQLGFEFDRLDDSRLLLRTIPEFFGGLPAEALADALIEALSKLPEEASVAGLEKALKLVNLPRLEARSVLSMHKRVSLRQDVTNEYLVVLDPTSLAKLFGPESE